MTIKAIETVYNGYRFRSRLEARWAVFFDTLDVKWEYEPEGFDLGEAGWYLPDFRLYFPDSSWYAEVKPIPLNDDERAKLRALDDNPPDGTMGAMHLVGVPEDPSWETAIDETGKSILCGWSGNTGFVCCWLGIYNNAPARIHRAVCAARQARFEHGETPR